MIHIPINLFLGSVFMIVSLIGAATAFPLLLDLVKPNRFYGIRIPKAFVSEENWYKINRFGGKTLLVAFSLLFLLGLSIAFMPAPLAPSMLIVVSLLPTLIMLGSLVPILVYSRKL